MGLKKKKWTAFLLAVCLVCSLTIPAAGAVETRDDSVAIISVTPDAVSNYTHPITFTVTIAYTLSSLEEGLIRLGFNTTKPDVYTVYDQSAVQAGAGTLTLSASITPVGWGTSYAPKGSIGNFFDSITGRRFGACVSLDAYPYDESNSSLCIDIQEIGHGVPTVELEMDALLQEAVSTEYNPDLALQLMQLADAAYEAKTNMVETLAQLGFPQDDIKREYTEKPRFDWDSAKYTIGRKFLSSGEQVVLIVIRGTEGDPLSLSPDWISNFHMGEAYSEAVWHEGFKAAAYEVFNHLKNDYFDGWLPNHDVRYVLTGHSRGAAIANLVSILLMDAGIARECVYDYNFACPDVARDYFWNWNPDDTYSNLFNIGNCSDPISQLPGFAGDTLPFALDFFVNKDKWYGKVIDALNQTSPELLYTSWGKYGRSYWFSNEWKDTSGLLPDFLSHSQDCYLDYLSKRLPLSAMKTWPEAQAAILSGGSGVHTLSGIFLCPVDVTFRDSEGNVLVSVKDGELAYTAAEDCCAVILTDGEKKLIRIQSQKDIVVDLLGTDEGVMSMILMEGDSISSEYTDAVYYENIALSEGKAIEAAINEGAPLDTVQVTVLDRKGSAVSTVQTDGTEARLDGPAKFTLSGKPGKAGVSWYLWIGLLLAAGTAAAVIILAVRARKKKRASDFWNEFDSPDAAEMDDILCQCGTLNPSWARTCANCGRKLKHRR